MHGLVALDENDQVIRPAILWNDGRSAAQTEYLNREIGKKALSKFTGNIAFAGFTAPKILWMRENEPENFARIRKIMLPKDYLAYRLSGVFCTDYSDASGTLLLDVEHKCWSGEMLKICGITEEQLPGLYESWEPVGTLKPEAAEELGLSEDVMIIAGAGDNAAAAVGTGTAGTGDVIYPWVHPAHCLFPEGSLALTKITRFIHSPMRTETTISWAACSAPHPVISGGWKKS